MKRLYLLSIVLLLTSSSVVHAMDEVKRGESKAEEAQYDAKSKATTAAEVTAILSSLSEADRASLVRAIVLLSKTSSPVVPARGEGKSEEKTEKANYEAKFKALLNASTAAEQLKILSSIPVDDRAAFVQMRTVDRWTALFTAKSGAVAKAILDAVPEDDRVAFVKMQSTGNWTALFYAPSRDVVAAILNVVPADEKANFVKMQANDGKTALFIAQSGEIATAILSAVPEDERANVVRIQDKYGNTALFQARPGVVAAILSAVPKADRADVVKIQNKFHKTALFEASSREAVDAILNAVPEVDRTDFVKIQDRLERKTALFTSQSGKLTAILSAIPEADRAACVNIKDNEGRTALFNSNDRDVIIQLLLIRGIDINVRDGKYVSTYDRIPELFAECVKTANKIIAGNNAARRNATVEELVANGMLRDTAIIFAQNDEQPQIEIPKYILGGKAKNPGAAYSCKDEKDSFRSGDWVIVKRSSGEYTYGLVQKIAAHKFVTPTLRIYVEAGGKSWESYPEIYRIPTIAAPKKGAAAGE